MIKDITFKDFELAALAINGGNYITVENCKVEGIADDLKSYAMYSQAKFSYRPLKSIIKKYGNNYLKTWYGDIPLYKIYEDLVKEIKSFE